ncbi:MAG: hypothetical protein IT424_08615 [Pirellulales bacterium]|nr:hypothetical protein [Pirellulales bacterium]
MLRYVTPCGLLTVVLLAGCDSGPATYDVSGKITYQGEPVTSGLINFRADGQPLRGGGIQADGTYQFNLPAGAYQVRIDTPPALPAGWKEGDPPAKMGPRQVPEKFGSFETSGLTATVDENTETINFDLQ